MKIHPIFQKYASKRPYFLAFVRSLEIPFYGACAPLKGKVLDLGCGDGYFLQALKKESPKLFPGPVYGLDLSDLLIKTHPYHSLTLYNGKVIPFKDQFFDHAISNCVFEHIPNLELTLHELNRVLKPGGRLVITVMANKWHDYCALPNWFWDKVQVHHNLLTLKDWQNIFRKNGFKVKQKQGYLSAKQVRFVEFGHFFSLPYLLAKLMFQDWSKAAWLYRDLVNSKRVQMLATEKIKPENSAALFFELEKV